MLKDTISTLRKEKGLSMKALAAKAGVQITRVSDIENGKTKDPQFSTMCKLSDALGFSLDKLRAELRKEGK